jgi:WD40 repeat protein
MALTILPNGDIVSGSVDITIKIWNPNDGTLKQTLNGHTNWVNALATLPNGDIVSGSSDKTIKIWSPNK